MQSNIVELGIVIMFRSMQIPILTHEIRTRKVSFFRPYLPYTSHIKQYGVNSVITEALH